MLWYQVVLSCKKTDGTRAVLVVEMEMEGSGRGGWERKVGEKEKEQLDTNHAPHFAAVIF